MNRKNFRPTLVDLIALLNVILFFGLCYVVYFDRFIHYRGREYLWEFFLYAILLMGIIVFIWRLVRLVPIHPLLLLFFQLGICMHFAGGLAIFHTSRLYDKIVFGIRYDKYVHLFNSFTGALFLQELYLKNVRLEKWLKNVQLVVITLGVGAGIEIVEYLVTLTVKVNGVGGYDNNMQDLVANLLGSLLAVVVIRWFRFPGDICD